MDAVEGSVGDRLLHGSTERALGGSLAVETAGVAAVVEFTNGPPIFEHRLPVGLHTKTVSKAKPSRLTLSAPAEGKSFIALNLALAFGAGLLIRFREGRFVLYRIPEQGDGATLVQQLLKQLPRDDEKLDVDFTRMKKVKFDRARRAAEFVRGNSED